MKQYLVDAFTDKVFSGNPAAVCVLDAWPDDQLMKNIALENNLSETAFVVKEPAGYHLRWFTPTDEINLCGHATLATAYVILHCQIADYWSQVLGKNKIVAYQASKRGGTLYCELIGDCRIRISGRAVLFAISELNIELCADL